MKAWHGDELIKQRTIERMRWHIELDELVHGYYQAADPKAAEGYRGCAIGCTLEVKLTTEGQVIEPERGWWNEMEVQYGIPYAVASTIDDAFEALNAHHPRDKQWVLDVLEAVPVGADLLSVDQRFRGLYDDEERAFYGAHEGGAFVPSVELVNKLLDVLRTAPQAK